MRPCDKRRSRGSRRAPRLPSARRDRRPRSRAASPVRTQRLRASSWSPPRAMVHAAICSCRGMAQSSGVKWSFLYYYVTPDWDPSLADFIASKATIAKGLDAMMVITFYNLYARGVAASVPGCTTDAPCVQAVLQRADLMKGYF